MSYVQVPPDSTGKKVHALEHVVGPDTVQTQVIHIADKYYPEHVQQVDVRGAASVRFAEGQPIMSAFGSIKTTAQRAIGVYECSQDSYDDLFSIEKLIGGESTYQPSASSTVLSVTGDAGSSVTRTTNRYHYYLPGSANFSQMTIACGDSGKSGNIRRWGLFDDNDGVYFELNGTTVNVVVRSSTSGTVNESTIPQNLWNRDKLDGTGTSAHILDVSRINVWWIDYQWLGAGRVRFGIFEPNGSRLVCHEVENAGANFVPYMRTGTLPLRTQNVNTELVGSSSELREVCMAVYTEGTFEDYTFWRHSGSKSTLSISAPETVVMAVRSLDLINNRHNAVTVYPETVNIYTDEPVEINIWQNIDIVGGVWSPEPGLTLERNTGGTFVYSTARLFKTIFVSAGVSNINTTDFFELNDEGITRNADGTAANWCITATKLSALDANIAIVVNYKELW